MQSEVKFFVGGAYHFCGAFIPVSNVQKLYFKN